MLPLVQDDPYLEPYKGKIHFLLERYEKLKENLLNYFGKFDQLTKSYDFFGLHYMPDQATWVIREWAPHAEEIFLIGDFNDWNTFSVPLHRMESNAQVWQAFLPQHDFPKLQHHSYFKLIVKANGEIRERLPAYTFRAVQDPETKVFSAQVWQPDEPYVWKHNFILDPASSLRIYEAHVGMAQEQPKVGTYFEFEKKILPRIHELGYNAIQLMAVQEHPYYGSFGYHVSNFYAPSSRFGNPDELRSLVDAAHGMGIAVIMDLVHSHSVKNIHEGLNEFDGSGHQYFHAGERGNHELWDSKLFNYGKWEVAQFLLSNIRYWLEEFRFDGFRFDGVTSMLYEHHGLNKAFTSYDDYFGSEADSDAINYLQLANEVAHQVKPTAVTIAEDVSGYPGLCRPIYDGGIGFDYRLGMGIPDFWIKMTKDVPDEEWQVDHLFHTLQNRRDKEKTIAYCESHDQALVGDKTLAFRLMDAEMYTHMSKFTPSYIIDRGMAIHKLIRAFTATLGGEAYLNFMGNEFGHPEWIDFPREGNDWSYHYARRQWSLVEDETLRYHHLADFDKVLMHVLSKYHCLLAPKAKELHMHLPDKVIAFQRGDLLVVANFHPLNEYQKYSVSTGGREVKEPVLNSEEQGFGGFMAETVIEKIGQDRVSFFLPRRSILIMSYV